MHNIVTLRGALVRDASAWAAYLTETIRLYGEESDVLFGSHLWPTWGRARVVELLELQRDLYAYVHDQSVRLINAGYTGAEIAEELALPRQLAAAWHTRGYYGTLSHNVKAVYQRYMGWFDANPAHLWQHPPVEQAKRYLACMGGADAVVQKAAEAVADGDLRWAAELLGHVLYAAPDHIPARTLQAEVFETLGHDAESGPWRNFYLTGAHELRDGIAATPLRGSADIIAALSTEQIFRSMAVRLDGPRAAEAGRILIRWELTAADATAAEAADPTAAEAAADEVWSVLVNNGVLTPMPGDAPGGESPQARIRLPRTVLDAVLSGGTTFVDEIAAGVCALEGDANALLTLRSLLTEPERDFPIVTP
jgi:alkyl sulfatase BDS1-like metallo-beta-lactamase superfamily hydrolase